MKVITCAGYGGTGSSAITDYLTEFSNIQTIPASIEFQLLSEPGGIFELEWALESCNQLIVDQAIAKFLNLCKIFTDRYPSILKRESFYTLVDNYLNSLGIITWRGGWYGSIKKQKNKKDKILEKLSYDYFCKAIDKQEYMLYEPETAPWRPAFQAFVDQHFGYITNSEIFYQKTKAFFNNLLTLISASPKPYLMIDHLIPPAKNEKYNNYIENLYTICVDKDPVDLYLQNVIFWGEGWIPTKDINQYIQWFKLTRLHRKNELENTIYKYLFINFEDLIFKYDKTSKKINNFLNLSEEDHKDKYIYFDPNKSIKNVNLENSYIFSIELQNNIKLIKDELSEYCYPFYMYNSERKEKKIVNETIQNIRNECDKIILSNKISKKQYLTIILKQLKDDFNDYFHIMISKNIIYFICKTIYLPFYSLNYFLIQTIDFINIFFKR